MHRRSFQVSKNVKNSQLKQYNGKGTFEALLEHKKDH